MKSRSVIIWVVVLVFWSGLSVAHADIIEVTVTGKIRDIPDGPAGNLFDSSVCVGETYKYIARYDTQNTGNITYENRYGVMAASGQYNLNPFYSETMFGNYTIISTLGEAFVLNDYTFHIGDEEDYLSLSSHSGTVQNTNSSAIPLFKGYTSIGLYDYSHIVFSSAQLPSVNAYNISNFNGGGIADFMVYDIYNLNVFTQGTVETLNAIVVPVPAALILAGIGLGFVTVMLRRKKL